MKRKNDSKFVRDLAEIMWGNDILRQRCVKKSRLREDDDRKELTPKKIKKIEGE